MKVILKQLKELIDPKLPLVSNLSNASSVLNQLPNINWCGFYLAMGERLYLGPFQGEPACTMIPFDKGVCGYAARSKKTVIVDDVNKFDGHIACSTLSKSEIVVPIIKDNEVKALIDIDSPIYNRFNDEDATLLEECAKLLKELFS
ncbi:MAG: GAF domain-containing protein [Bacilli bacterium]|nr:GAF domain-containing protein [Bacilli bacterium]